MWRPRIVFPLALVCLLVACNCDPEAGDGKKDDKKASTKVTVPDVVGLEQTAAVEAIASAGLRLGQTATEHSDTVAVDLVLRQDPDAGSRVDKNSAVDLVVSLGPQMVAVPDVVGSPQLAAEVAITGAGLTVGPLTHEHSETVSVGAVLSQDPAAGTEVAVASAVALVISLGPQGTLVAVPDVVGQSQSAAETALVAAQLQVGSVTQDYSDTVAAGDVLSQDPAAGQQVASGSSVDLVVSLGPQNTAVPDVVGLTSAEAESALTAAGLELGTVTQVIDNNVPAGQVISQDPAAATVVANGSAVDLVVSLGPSTVTVPDVTGLSQEEASVALVAAGLVLGGVTRVLSETVPTGQVLQQDPEAGASVSNGSAVEVVVSMGNTVADPNLVATDVDPTVITDMFAVNAFLFAGDPPVQAGVAPGTIERKRIAILRGGVTDTLGVALAGAVIRIVNGPQYGQTVSRADGRYDMAVNGGGAVVVQFSKQGYLTAQRQVRAGWREFVVIPDVALVALDSQVTSIDLSQPIQVARSSLVSDGDGERQGTLMFRQGTSAEMVLPDGSSAALSHLDVRITEYTQGENGFAAMPAMLPPSSAYTYCVEFSVDEALAADATTVRFSTPVVFHVENFLNFPAGEAVPVGWYDRVEAVWKAFPNGLVIDIVGESGGLAQIDSDGDGMADAQDALDALGVTLEEQTELAALYDAGQSLWRVAVPHFTPVDCNWPSRCRGDCAPPDDERDDDDDDEGDDPPCQSGSRIDCHNQILGDTVELTGTPIKLSYASDRVPGYLKANQLEIPVTGASVPDGVLKIHVQVQIAGRSYPEEPIVYDPAPYLIHQFEWPRVDAYGRELEGFTKATVRIGFQYEYSYFSAGEAFGLPTTLRGAILEWPTRENGQAWIMWREFPYGVGTFYNHAVQAGLWNIDVHHVYDPANRILYFGNGSKRSARSLPFGKLITRVAGTFNDSCSGYAHDVCAENVPALGAILKSDLRALAVGPDGSIYFGEPKSGESWVVRKIDPDGILTTIGGGACPVEAEYCTNDFHPGESALLSTFDCSIIDIELGANGWIYFMGLCGTRNGMIYAIDEQGILHHIAGDIDPETRIAVTEEAVPAKQADLGQVTSMDIAEDGSIYFADTDASLLRRVGTNGIITRVAGRPYHAGNTGEGEPAVDAWIWHPAAVEVYRGDIYFTSALDYVPRIRRIDKDGIINDYIGASPIVSHTFGVPKDEFRPPYNTPFLMGPDGVFYFPSGYGFLTVENDGYSHWYAGTDEAVVFREDPDNKPARRIDINSRSFTVAPDNTLYYAEQSSIYRIHPYLPEGVDSQRDILIPATNGSEVYHFDSSGRHLRTLDSFTGHALYTFAYDAEGRLASITDGDGQVLTIERDTSGVATEIVAPFGHHHGLAYDSNGYLSEVSNPAAGTYNFSYDDDGLLVTARDPNGDARAFLYDAKGALIQHTEMGGSYRIINKTTLPSEGDRQQGYQVDVTTAEGRVTSYRLEKLYSGDTRMQMTSPEGYVSQIQLMASGVMEWTTANGTRYAQLFGPDPRFDMDAPILEAMTVTLPSGALARTSLSRQVELVNVADPVDLVSLTDTMVINDKTYTMHYDNATQTVTVTTPQGRQGQLEWDSSRRLLSEILPGQGRRTFVRNGLGQLESIQQQRDATTARVDIEYDSNGFVSQLSDADSRDWVHVNDVLGRTELITRPDGESTAFSYDEVGNLMSVTPPDSEDHDLTYNYMSQAETYVAPDIAGLANPTLSIARDLDYRLTSITMPDGSVIGYTYTGGSTQPSAITTPLGDTLLQYEAHSGLLATATTSHGDMVELSHDGHVLTALRWSGTVNGLVELERNADFLPAASQVNGAQRVVRGYDTDGLLVSAGDLLLTRHPDSGWVSATSAGLLTTTSSHNHWGQIKGFMASDGSSDLYGYQVSRDLQGRIVDLTEYMEGASAVYSHFYDDADRLLEVQQEGSAIAVYSYDANGNRLSFDNPQTGETAAATYDAQDRLLTYGSISYTWDSNGVLLSQADAGQVTTYDYDLLGNLLQVELPDGTSITYTADALGHRIGKAVDGVAQKGWLYGEQLGPIAELDASGVVVSRFVYAAKANVPAYMIQGSDMYRLLVDHRGSVRLVVHMTTGAVAQRLDYDAFGRVITDSSPGFQPFGFAGGHYDPDTGLTRFGMRDYDAHSGRWTAKDPALFSSGSTNFYAYVDNDPVNYVDPLGLGRSSDCDEDDRDPERDEDDDCEGERRRDPDWLRDRQDNPDLPGWLADLAQWTGATLDLLGFSGSTIGMVGSGLSLLAWPLAFEAALDEGDRQADVFRDYEDRIDDMMREADGCR